MNERDALDIVQAAIWTIIVASGPAVGAAMLVERDADEVRRPWRGLDDDQVAGKVDRPHPVAKNRSHLRAFVGRGRDLLRQCINQEPLAPRLDRAELLEVARDRCLGD